VQAVTAGPVRLVAVLLVLAVLPVVLPSAAAAAVRSPVFEPAPCPMEVPSGALVDCGYVEVPEARDERSGRRIRLLVAVLRSTAADPAPDPLFVTSGGPGSSSAGLLGLADSIYVRDRDVVVVEQRGTRWSEPFLACPEVERALLAGLRTADPVAAETQREVAAARACAARLRADGNDLSAYTTAENAADLADIRTALGYEQWNLWGLSYSTRLALTVLRDHRTACVPSCSTPSRHQTSRSTTCR
jgi:pimeloyl-ACP methyl ester carboxylesterase